MKMTKKILTQHRLKELLHYNPETGIFTRKTINKGHITGSVNNNGSGKKYIVIRVDNKLHYAHRLAWMYMTGEFPEIEIDHIDGNGCNNIFYNIRVAGKQENNKNSRLQKNNTSGCTGVVIVKNRWIAQVMVNGKNKYLGSYIERWDAISARMSANNKYGFHKNHGMVRDI